MEWCCFLVEDLAQMAGRRGLSIITAAQSGRDVFFLQGRAIDVGARMPSSEVPLTLATQQAIAFCPGCGVELADYYAATLGALRRQDLVIEP